MEPGPESASTKPVKGKTKRHKKRPPDFILERREARRASSQLRQTAKNDTATKAIANLQSATSRKAVTTRHGNSPNSENNAHVNYQTVQPEILNIPISPPNWPFIDVNELAKRWRRSPKTIKNNLSSGKLKLRHQKIMGKTLFHMDDVLAYEKLHSIGDHAGQ